MKREILFRGQLFDNGEWVEGYYLKCASVFLAVDDGIVDGHWDVHKVNPATVGQYTGLKDKNGKKIFEGDIVVCRKYIGGNWVEYAIERGYVEFVSGAFGLHRTQGFYRPFKDWLDDYEIEIVGNIHDNPPGENAEIVCEIGVGS